MKGYSTFIFGLLRLGYQSAQIERMLGEMANKSIRDGYETKRPHHFIALVGDGEE